MNTYRKPKKVSIVYFTGTGSTGLVAEQFLKTFQEKGMEAVCHELHHRKQYVPEKTDMLFLIYPVYAANAPRPVYEFISQLPYEYRCKTVVISVSGGGEVTPNKANRLHCISRLTKKGYPVVYEKMLVMPSNIFISTPDELSVRLIEILPYKVEYIVKELSTGIRRRTKPDVLNRMLSFLLEIEKVGSRLFGKNLKVNEKCNGCGICEKGCPMGNIKLKYNVPSFGYNCTLCMRCIYTCPKHALEPKFAKFFILKGGYPLKRWIHSMNHEKCSSVNDLTKGFAFSGLKRYFLEK